MALTDLAVRLAFAGLLATAPLAAQTTVNYTYTGAEGMLNCRIDTRSYPSDASGPPKAFQPGLCDGSYLFQTFAFSNPLAVAQAFRVTFIRVDNEPAGNSTILSAYDGSFDPNDVAAHYLGDGGVACADDPCDPAAPGSFSILAPGRARIIVVANHVDPGSAQGGSFAFETNFPAAPLTTVPEPSEIVLLLTGLGGIAAVARRRVTARTAGSPDAPVGCSPPGSELP